MCLEGCHTYMCTRGEGQCECGGGGGGGMQDNPHPGFAAPRRQKGGGLVAGEGGLLSPFSGVACPFGGGSNRYHCNGRKSDCG